MHRPLRILHGPRNIAGMASLVARAQRRRGHDAVSVCLPSGPFGFQPDFVYGGGDSSAPAKRVRDVWLSELWQQDVLHLYYDEGFGGPSLWDAKLMKALGRKVVLTFLGCDVRDRAANLDRPVSVCHECSPIGCSANRESLIAWSRQADLVLVTTPDLLEVLPFATYIPLPVDALALAGPSSPAPAVGNGPFRLLHAPTDEGKKGTRHLVAAVERLRARGVALELVLPGTIPQADLRRLAVTCDAAVDQLMAGVFGTFGAEMMALGLPVIARIDPAWAAAYGSELPVLSAGPDTIETVLGQLAELSPETRRQIGSRSRAWALRHHASDAVADRLDEAYARMGLPVR